MIVGQSYNGTVLPLVTGFATLGLASLAIMWGVKSGASG